MRRVGAGQDQSGRTNRARYATRICVLLETPMAIRRRWRQAAVAARRAAFDGHVVDRVMAQNLPLRAAILFAFRHGKKAAYSAAHRRRQQGSRAA